MHVYIIEVTHEDGTSSIHQVMDTPRGAYESMRDYAHNIDAKVEETSDNRWELTDTNGALVAVIESVRRPVMSFNNGR